VNGGTFPLPPAPIGNPVGGAPPFGELPPIAIIPVNPPDGGGVPIAVEPPAAVAPGGGVLPVNIPPAPLEERLPWPGALDAPDEHASAVNVVNAKKSALAA